MRALRTTRDNLIEVNFGKQEEVRLLSAEDETSEQSEKVTCENGVCNLNWSPTRPAKKTEAA